MKSFLALFFTTLLFSNLSLGQSQYFKLKIEIDIPAEVLPNKSQIIIGPEVTGHPFKWFAFQHLKARGNAQIVPTQSSCHLIYRDSTILYKGQSAPENIKPGTITIEVIDKKGNSESSTLSFKWGEPIRYYFDEDKEQFFTCTATYTVD